MPVIRHHVPFRYFHSLVPVQSLDDFLQALPVSFADYFFDGFVVDWMVQDRINNARHQVEEAIRRTEYIINQLQHM